MPTLAGIFYPPYHPLMFSIRHWLSWFTLIGLFVACRQSTPPVSKLPAPILTLHVANDGTTRLWQYDDIDQAKPLSPADWDIFDYTVSADGEQILLTHLQSNNSSSLWLMPATGGDPQLLHNCNPHFCRQPIWQPDNAAILYAQYDQPADLLQNKAPDIYWLDLATKQTGLVDLYNQQAGYGASYSPAGNWFSYASPLDHSLELYNLTDDSQTLLHVHTDKPIVWKPDESGFIVLHSLADGVRFGTQLHWVDAGTGKAKI